VNEILIETIGRIEEQQREHHRMIENLLMTSDMKAQNEEREENDFEVKKELEIEEFLDNQTELDTSMDFETSFKRFFKMFYSLSVDEKPIKIRKLLRNSSQRDAEKVLELLDLFQRESIQRDSRNTCSPETQKNSLCDCNTCPYQKELQKIEDYCKTFLLPDSDPLHH